MPWTLTTDVEEYAAAAGDLLGSDPLRHTTALTVLERLRTGRGFGGPAILGWWSETRGGPVTGAFSWTGHWPLLLAELPAGSASPLADAFAGLDRVPSGVTGVEGEAVAFAEAFKLRTGRGFELKGGTRLYRLGTLRRPDPPPAGAARPAVPSEREVLIRWWLAFASEVGESSPDPEGDLDHRIAAGAAWVWEDGGTVVSLAAAHPPAAGMVRVGPVYTPPDRRGHGYAAAVTVAATQAALDAGASEVCLFTDAAHELTNRLYPRIGFELVEDRVSLRFLS